MNPFVLLHDVRKGTDTWDRLAVVGVGILIVEVKIGKLVIPHVVLGVGKGVAISPVTVEVAVGIDTRPPMPLVCGHVVDPGYVRRGEVKLVEVMASLLVDEASGVIDPRIGPESFLNSVGGNALGIVTLGLEDHASALLLLAQEVHGRVHAGNRVLSTGSMLNHGAGNWREGELGISRIVPDLGLHGADYPDFTVQDNDGLDWVREGLLGAEFKFDLDASGNRTNIRVEL